MAEGIARQAFSGLGTYHVSSAGTSAIDGLPASALAIEVAGTHSIDLSGHRSRLLAGELVRESDLILTMGENHRATVGIIDPGAHEYTFLLTEFCEDEEGDIPDPIGGGVREYERTFEVVRKCVEGLKKQIDTFNKWKQ